MLGPYVTSVTSLVFSCILHLNQHMNAKMFLLQRVFLLLLGYTTQGLDRYGFNARSLNNNSCNYLFKGPFATLQSRRIWAVLLQQPKAFLMTLTRTCPALEPFPLTWLQQNWITEVKDVTGNTAVLVVMDNYFYSK